MNGGLKSIFGRFPKVFWVVQIFELMERAAYYTMVPVIAIHAFANVGVSQELAFTLTVFMYPIQYGLPIFSGPLAEKVGYKRQMTLAFSILTIAYLVLSFAFDSITLILSVIMIGIGIGIYKPLISATVAKCTVQKDRNMAFAIYYLIVNIAAAIFPIVYVLLEFGGILNAPGYYNWVFRAGSIFFLVNIFFVIFIFKEVPRSGDVKTVSDVVANIKIAFKDQKFLVMVILVGMFWALYSTFLNVLPMVLINFRLVPLWFTAMLIGVFNPATIILAGPFMIKLSERIESIKWLMGGVLLYTVGFSIIGFTLEWRFVIFGIVIASIGEFMIGAAFPAFTSKLAPKETVSAYIGGTFLATMLGITLGTLGFGLMASYVAFDLRMPNFTYGILISISLILVVAFMGYYRIWGQDIQDRAKRIREMEEGKDEKEEEKKKEPLFFKLFDSNLMMIIPLILVPIILIGTYNIGTKTFYGGLEDDDLVRPPFNIDDFEVSAITDDYSPGTLMEGASTTQMVTAEVENGQLIKSITFQLTWEDEDDFTRLLRTWENEPDEFDLTATFADDENQTQSTSGANAHGSSQTIEVTFEFDYEYSDVSLGIGDWAVEITLTTAGDLTNPRSPILYTDDSNTYELDVIIELYE
jgi:MFS family permease